MQLKGEVKGATSSSCALLQYELSKWKVRRVRDAAEGGGRGGGGDEEEVVLVLVLGLVLVVVLEVMLEVTLEVKAWKEERSDLKPTGGTRSKDSVTVKAKRGQE